METLIEIMQQNAIIAIFLSIVISIIIAILGVVPSFFITIANITVFGFVGGLCLSIIGESLGAVVSFYLYRLGFKKVSSEVIKKNKNIQKIVNADNKNAMGLVFAFRLFPYIPSGIVTYAAAIGSIDVISFTISSTLGKVPALFLESYLSFIAIKSSANFKIMLSLISIIFIIYMIKKILNYKKKEK